MLLSKQRAQTQTSLYETTQCKRELEIQSSILAEKLHQKTIFLYIPVVALLIKMSRLDVSHHESTQKHCKAMTNLFELQNMRVSYLACVVTSFTLSPWLSSR